jgi:tetratricopeptide (TPR) repeat protein
MEPLGVILSQDRDLACFFDGVKGELIIESTTAGEERIVVIVANDYNQHGSLGQQDSARIVFGGLRKKKKYTMGLVIRRSPDSLVEEAERISKTHKQRALTLVERALALNPALGHAWRRKAYILRELGRRDEALSAAERSVLVDPDYALGWRCKGAILRDRGEHQLGLECYLRSLALDPTDGVCWTNKGNALSALGRDEEATEAYAEAERMSELYPDKY